MNLLLTAFGQSPKLTIKERAEKIIELHGKFCDIVGVYEWKLYNPKTAIIDIRNIEASYSEIYKQVKQGLNTAVTKPIRYKENDIADISSHCWFYNLNSKSFNALYTIGYPSKYVPSIVMTVENITDPNIFTKEIILKVAKLFVSEWKPYTLSVTDKEYFHRISKASELKTPWTGWFTYLSDELKPLPTNIKFKTQKEDNGVIVWTTDEYFKADNTDHIKNALELENIFSKAGIRI
jgi:hypothetical protein